MDKESEKGLRRGSEFRMEVNRYIRGKVGENGKKEKGKDIRKDRN